MTPPAREQLRPGVVLAVRTNGLAARLIRFGSALRELTTGKPGPNLDNHVVIVHHTDPKGTLWGIEGRPGGVGMADLTKYLSYPLTVSNAAQPMTDGQGVMVAMTCESLLGTSYDWQAILTDAEKVLPWPMPDWAPDGKTGVVPAHLVCSALAAYAYAARSLPYPQADGVRLCTPADWTLWGMTAGWETP